MIKTSDSVSAYFEWQCGWRKGGLRSLVSWLINICQNNLKPVCWPQDLTVIHHLLDSDRTTLSWLCNMILKLWFQCRSFLIQVTVHINKTPFLNWVKLAPFCRQSVATAAVKNKPLVISGLFCAFCCAHVAVNYRVCLTELLCRWKKRLVVCCTDRSATVSVI